jgi:hypothetical protein
LAGGTISYTNAKLQPIIGNSKLKFMEYLVITVSIGILLFGILFKLFYNNGVFKNSISIPIIILVLS